MASVSDSDGSAQLTGECADCECTNSEGESESECADCDCTDSESDSAESDCTNCESESESADSERECRTACTLDRTVRVPTVIAPTVTAST